MHGWRAKRHMLSPFSVFRDDQNEEFSKKQRSRFVRLGKTQSVVLDPYDLITNGDDDVDSNAAGVAASTVPPRLKHDIPDRSRRESLCKPLPPLPSADLATEERRPSQGTRLLGDKSTNLRQRPQAAYSKLPLDALVAFDRLPSSTVSSEGQATMGNRSSKPPGLASDKAKIKELDTRIDHLTQQTQAQDAEPRNMAAEYDKTMEKQSPFQRSKEVLSKASRAFKGRVTNFNSNSKTSRSNLQSSSQTHLGLENNSVFGLDEDSAAKQRLGRRIAEGENLSNPKIQHLMGNGNIPRKPLPVYESMKSRERLTEPDEDPFSDGNEHIADHSSQDFSHFDFGFDKNSRESTEGPTHKSPTDKNIAQHIRESERLATVGNHTVHNKKQDPEHHAPFQPNESAHIANAMAKDPASAASADSDHVVSLRELRSETTPPGGFSNRISGLRQHPYVPGVFATPIDTSTPRARQYLAERASREDALKAINTDDRANSATHYRTSKEDVNSASSDFGSKKLTSPNNDDAGPVARIDHADTKNCRHSAGSANSEESTSTITPAPTASVYQARAKRSETDTTDDAFLERQDLYSITDKGKGKDATNDALDDSVSSSQTLFRMYPHLQRPDSMILGSYSRMHRRRLTSVNTDSVIRVDDHQTDDVASHAGGESKSHDREG